MKKNKILLFLFAVSLFFSTGFLKKTNTVEDKWKRNIGADFTGISDLSEYEVKFTYTGYTTFYGTPEECPIRKNGEVVLSGSLKGIENVGRYDNILYRGVLQLYINMDICSAKRLPNGEDKLCGMTVTGLGNVMTKLEIFPDGQNNARSAYIQFEYDSTKHGKFGRSVVGDCDHKQMVEEEKMVPNNTIAAIFNGLELPMLTNNRTLHVGRYAEKNSEGGATIVEVLRKVR